MSCRSEEKVLCPWCGAKMTDGWHENGLGRFGYYLCCECYAKSPDVAWPMGLPKEQFDVLNKAVALRRYTPQKPMTWDEANCKWHLATLEKKGEDEIILGDMCGDINDCTIVFASDDPHDPRGGERLEVNEYGKTWRLWEHVPTDEERSAAEWITD